MSDTSNAAPRIAVVSVYHNRRDHVVASLRSILDQTHRDIDFVVVDDGSTDDTLERIRSIEDPRLRVIAHANQGFTRSIATAVAATDAPLVAVHGSGDLSHPERLAVQAAALAANPEVPLCATASRNVDAETGRELDVQRFERTRMRREDFLDAPPFTHGSVMFRRDAYDRAGGYDPFFAFSQDWDLWLRMLRGAEGLFIDRILYDRLAQPDGASYNAKKAVRQLLYKYLALALSEMDDAERRATLARAAEHGLEHTLASVSEAVRRDIARRRIKLRLMRRDEPADELLAILDRDYGGMPRGPRLVDAAVSMVAAIGLQDRFLDFVRWVERRRA